MLRRLAVVCASRLATDCAPMSGQRFRCARFGTVERPPVCAAHATSANARRTRTRTRAQERFGVGKICEFYGATEGAGALINTDGRVGAVGFYSVLVDPLLKVRARLLVACSRVLLSSIVCSFNAPQRSRAGARG